MKKTNNKAGKNLQNQKSQEQNLQDKHLQNRHLQGKHWYEKNECASSFWLKITLMLVSVFYHPILRPILKLCVAFVTAVYFVFSPNERRNIARFYENLDAFCKSQNPSENPKPSKKSNILKQIARKWHKNYQVYSNFYEFGNAICDKIAAWLGKIDDKDIQVRDMEAIKNKLLASKESKKGQILVVSHFGNIEVCRALRNSVGEIPLVILMYEKIAQDFIALLKGLSKHKESAAQDNATNSGIMLIDDLDMDSLFKLKDLLENGVNIGIMGDRVAISHSSSSKNAKFDFLGKSAYFPQGAFLLAGVLNAKISMLWCEKIKGKYTIELEQISQVPVVFERRSTKEAQIKELMQKYVDSLQKRVVANSKSWFNFYDFWSNKT